MKKDGSEDLIRKWLDDTQYWVSGLYISDEGQCPAVIAVQKTGEVCDATVYIYSYLGNGPSHYSKYERVVWLVGTDTVHRYSLVDETQLELQDSVTLVGPDEELDMYDFFDMDARDVADLLCPHLEPLTQFADAGLTWSEAAEDDGFEEAHSDLIVRESPDFWS